MKQTTLGVSFSVKYANDLSINPKACLTATLLDLHVRRLRLMSYWDVHEPKQKTYNFTELDWQLELAKKYGATVSLAIGLRQPRWPESHWPHWATNMAEEEWQNALHDFIKTVINRYKKHPCLESWQLENEALLKTFGLYGNFDRKRLVSEYNLVRRLDRKHPIIMTTSDSWGIPFKKPHPDMYGISIYRRFYDRGEYRISRRPPFFYKLRGRLIRLVTGKQTFIHELQAEPWGPKATNEMKRVEQAITMNPTYLKETIAFAKKTNLSLIYLWGLEWWYWLKVTHQDSEIWDAAKSVFTVSSDQ